MELVSNVSQYLTVHVSDNEQKTVVAIDKVEVRRLPTPCFAEDDLGDYLVGLWPCNENRPHHPYDRYTLLVSLENGETYVAHKTSEYSIQAAEERIPLFLKQSQRVEMVPYTPGQYDNGAYYRNYPRFVFKDLETGEMTEYFFIKL